MSAETEELKTLVQKHTVKYESWPHRDMYDGHLVVDGFSLELHGTHDQGHTVFSPGCPFCWQTYSDLKKIAENILPKEERPSFYEVESFDHSLHSEGRGPEEVILVIRIEHRDGYFSAVDACEERCLGEMESKLNALGVSGWRRR